MQNVPRTGFGERFFWGMMFGLPAIFVLGGLVMIVAGAVQVQHDPGAARLAWAGALVTISGVIGWLAARRFKQRGGAPY